MANELDARSLVELGRLRQRLRQLEEELGLHESLPKAPLMARLGVDREVGRLVGEHASDFVSIHAANGDYLFAGPTSERLFGWRPEQLVGESAYAFFHEDDLEAIAADHAAHSIGQGGQRTISYRLRCADGSFSRVETTSRALLGPNGIEQIICVTRKL